MRWWQRRTAEQHPVFVADEQRQQHQQKQQPQQQHQHQHQQQQQQQQMENNDNPSGLRSVSAAAKAFLLSKRRLRLDPEKKLVFLYEPGKQVSSAVKIKNTSRSNVAFKFQTNAPKSCFMRPPNGVIKPKETIYATVVKFVEQPERPQQHKKSKEKFKIVSLKVKEGTDYIPELFEEQRELVAVERVLHVVFIDPQHSSPAELEKLQKRLAEAEAAQAARKKPTEEKNIKGGLIEGLVIDEWKERREKYLARQQVEAADSL